MFEERGWEGDLLYPGLDDTCTLGERLPSPKNPKNPQNTTNNSCSLHEILKSPIATETNYASSSSMLPTLTKQAVLCEGQSALDVALQHPDLQGLEPQDLCGSCQQGKRQNPGNGAPPVMQLEVVREPSSKVNLGKSVHSNF